MQEKILNSLKELDKNLDIISSDITTSDLKDKNFRQILKSLKLKFKELKTLVKWSKDGRERDTAKNLRGER